jgi:DMSO/TMAO reductase YedYZ heme-binding membrane subunit
MSDLGSRPNLRSPRLPWLIAGVACSLSGIGGAWSLAQAYPPLVYLTLSRVSGWLSLGCLALTLCVSPWARASLRLWQGPRWAPHAASLRRTLGMTSAWLALLHAGFGAIQLHEPGKLGLAWLLETAHARAGLSALLILVLLLLTSFPSVVRALHLRAWKELHRLAYVGFACAAQHVLLSPFAPRVWVLGLIGATLLIGMLRLVRRPRPVRS